MTPSEVCAAIGIDRFCVNPAVGAAILWIRADSDDDVPTSRLQEPLSKVFAEDLDHRYSSDYARRFLGAKTGEAILTDGSRMTRTRLLDEAFLDLESYLRRFSLGAMGLPLNMPTTAFKDHPRFVRAHSAVLEARAPADTLTDFALTRCPKCFLVGATDVWFGTRKIAGKEIAQSWCYLCRSRGSIPTAQPTKVVPGHAFRGFVSGVLSKQGRSAEANGREYYKEAAEVSRDLGYDPRGFTKSAEIPELVKAAVRAKLASEVSAGRSRVERFRADDWFALAAWGKETEALTKWERRFVYGVGTYVARNGALTENQRPIAEKILAKAIDAGFA